MKTPVCRFLCIGHCCEIIEIFCPCSEEELHEMVHFFYNGQSGYEEQKEFVESLLKINENLIKIFGYPKTLCLHDQEKTFCHLDPDFTDGNETIEDSIDTKEHLEINDVEIYDFGDKKIDDTENDRLDVLKSNNNVILTIEKN